MTQIILAFMFIGAVHIHGLWKAQFTTIFIFAVLWTMGLAVAILVSQGIFLPIVDLYNSAYNFLLDLTGMAHNI
ncbi:MAG: hypothetical protein SCK28_04825 [Bacillota bacterium]|nr:hypothetical protein [Bacillota bacterium]